MDGKKAGSGYSLATESGKIRQQRESAIPRYSVLGRRLLFVAICPLPEKMTEIRGFSVRGNGGNGLFTKILLARLGKEKFSKLRCQHELPADKQRGGCEWRQFSRGAIGNSRSPSATGTAPEVKSGCRAEPSMCPGRCQNAAYYKTEGCDAEKWLIYAFFRLRSTACRSCRSRALPPTELSKAFEPDQEFDERQRKEIITGCLLLCHAA